MTVPHFTAVLLAGGLRSSPLQHATHLPPAMLPIDRAGTTVGRAWIGLLALCGACANIRVVTSTMSDAELLSAHLEEGAPFDIRFVVDPEPARGTAGVLRDVTRDLPCNMPLLAIEASAFPPQRLDSLFAAQGADEVVVVGVSDDLVPAGAFLMRAGGIDSVPRVGFSDLKEQFIADAVRRNVDVRTAVICERSLRVRDREGYIACVAAMAERDGDLEPGRTRRGSIISPSATVHPTAVVIDSVVLEAASIGAGAVVARSVVAAGGVIRPGSNVIDTVVIAAARSSARQRSVPHAIRDRAAPPSAIDYTRNTANNEVIP